MATGNSRTQEVGEASTNQDSLRISASCKILQDLASVIINPEESIPVGSESWRLKTDSSSDTPDKYPNAPHSSPIDLQCEPNIPFSKKELLACLNKLTRKILSSESTKDESPEMSRFRAENPTRSYLESSHYMESEVELDTSKGILGPYKNGEGSCSLNATSSSVNAEESTEPFPENVTNQMEKLNLLGVDSGSEFTTDFYRRNIPCDEESIIANCGSDVSDISLDDAEFASSDDDSGCVSKDRIKFEALSIDSMVNSSITQRFHHCKPRGKRKRTLSLDEKDPSKILHTTDFSKTEFELTI